MAVISGYNYQPLNNKFITSIYRKLTFNGVSKHFESFIPNMYSGGLIETLVRKGFRLYSNYENFYQEIKTLKSIFKHNDYPQNFVNQCINKVLNKLFI